MVIMEESVGHLKRINWRTEPVSRILRYYC